MSWPRGLSDETKIQVKALWETCNSAGVIADKLGMSRNSVVGLVHRNGWKRPDGMGTERSRDRKRYFHIPASKPLPPPKIVADIPEPEPLGKPNTFAEQGCRWIHGDVGSNWIMCGHGEDTWCKHHKRRVYVPHHPARKSA